MGGMGGMNMQNLMKQAQKMQRQMEEVQASLQVRFTIVTQNLLLKKSREPTRNRNYVLP